MVASEIKSSDTPRRCYMKQSVRKLMSELAIKDEKFKSIRQIIRRQQK